MLSLFRIQLLAALPLLMLAAPALAPRASDHNPDHFPLRVHVVGRTVHRAHRYGGHAGFGKANLIEGDQIVGVEFTYDCEYKFRDSEGDEDYPARWKHEGLSVDILMGVIGSDTATHTCELKVAIKENVLYRRVDGKVVSMSPREYAAIENARAERQQALAPVDLDPNHYPVSISLLQITWTGEVSGLQIATGQGNIRTPTGLNAVDFSLHCPVKIQPTPDGRYLLGRWLTPGTHLQLLLRSVDVDGGPGATCDVVTAVEPDVYVRDGDSVKAVPQQDRQKKYPPLIPPPH